MYKVIPCYSLLEAQCSSLLTQAHLERQVRIPVHPSDPFHTHDLLYGWQVHLGTGRVQKTWPGPNPGCTLLVMYLFYFNDLYQFSKIPMLSWPVVSHPMLTGVQCQGERGWLFNTYFWHYRIFLSPEPVSTGLGIWVTWSWPSIEHLTEMGCGSGWLSLSAPIFFVVDEKCFESKLRGIYSLHWYWIIDFTGWVAKYGGFRLIFYPVVINHCGA